MPRYSPWQGLAIAGGLCLALADWVGSAPANITLIEY